MRYGWMVLGIFMLALPFCVHAEGAELTGRDVMVRVDERPNGDNRSAILTMTLEDSRGSRRVREMRSRSMDEGRDVRTLMVFLQPGDVRGTAFLSYDYHELDKEDDKWLWMPALRRIRRISGAARRERFMGSDFSYDDMGKRHVDQDTHILEGVEELDGLACWVVLSRSVEEDPAYEKVRYWVRKDADLVVKAEYYDRDGLLKVFRVLKAEKVQGFWTVLHSEMNDTVRRHRTIMENRETSYDTDMDPEIFSPARLRQVQP